MGKFPHEGEPDRNRFLPHHYVQGAWGLALVALHYDATLVLVPLAVSLFGWYHAWFRYPQMGATLTLTGLTGALVVSFLTPMFDTTALLLALLTIAWAADDAIEHAFDVPTPLDLIWKRHLKERIGR